MDTTKSQSCSMILEVLIMLSRGPHTFDDLSNERAMNAELLRSVMSAAVSAGLIGLSSGSYQLTKKGARTAIYLLAVNEWMDFSTLEYRELMHALDHQLHSDAIEA